MQCDGNFRRSRLGSARIAKRRSLRRAGTRRLSKSQRSDVAGRDRPEFDGDLQFDQSDLTNRSPATAVKLMPVGFVVANKTKFNPVGPLPLWKAVMKNATYSTGGCEGEVMKNAYKLKTSGSSKSTNKESGRLYRFLALTLAASLSCTGWITPSFGQVTGPVISPADPSEAPPNLPPTTQAF